jgi:hypothetical protein
VQQSAGRASETNESIAHRHVLTADSISETFVDGQPSRETVGITLRAISVGAVFSVVGAVTADSVFWAELRLESSIDPHS